MKIKLSKPILHRGESLEVLDIPLEEITGNDLIEVEKQLTQSGEAFVVTDFSRSYLIAVAARAAHLPVEALKTTSAKDFTKITIEVRNFLIVSDSEENEEEPIPANSLATSSDE